MSESVSVLQWNVWYREDIKNIGAFLLENKADIICLQELTFDHPEQTVRDAPAYIAELLGYNYFCKEIPIEGTDGNKYMIANGIFSKHPLVDSHFVFINEPQGVPGADEYRAYIEATLDINGTKMSVGTTHMSYTHRFETSENKQQETARLVTELQKHTSNFIFTGDLNTLPDSPTIDAINQVLQQAGPDLDQKTWATKPFTYGGFEASTLDWRLDYIFTTQDVITKSAQILSTDFSDHLPILANLEIN